MKKITSLTTGLVVAAALVVGCQPAADTPPADTADSGQSSGGTAGGESEDHGHSHSDGPHHGAVADWGGGTYHVEFTVDHDAEEATVYVLGSDAKSAAPIDAESLLLSIKEPSFQVELKPQPLEGEADWKSSRFVGQHEKLGIVQEFAGTISGQVDGTPYAGDFKEEPHGDHEH
ncbi:hypothetical protein [Stratiformator vulcanicus]|uniref:Lipoprotein n=1 Tax=Stratiformator vulcanicus TaxID=2527980 RepID=A0A517R1C7_9PLAN|nr:hypothetical protein [Stratiformator vulcanicus]QDT37697.1 hypothetical protein Pan189_20790 [Stratiformator vulcanicus]